ncbi:hypothetical protein RJ639_018025 [Escallonia herrerae]|uniref:RNA ligase/cyclic nucleotide phosphodiesterase family protein n=1 Tax=Escallonia herrerae TaxID=1293975 RepID=A0AA88VA92_9ASTE|nr:hypothetical protein RJ639_018025 [Escallonia herrerae]
MKNVYSVWALPPEDLKPRLKKLMGELRSEFNGPEFEPHVTVVGAVSLTEGDARDKFKSACEGLKAYNAKVEKVATGSFFYQCVFLLLHPTAEFSVRIFTPGVETSAHCCSHFGYRNSTPYMPHLSLLYADLMDEEKKIAQERANALDENVGSLSFQITRLALYRTDTEDKTLNSWEKIAECDLHTS